MSKKVAVWAASMVAGLIAAYLIIAVLGIPAERFGAGFLIGTTFFIGLLFLIPMDHFIHAGIIGDPTPRKQK
ncbi:hypothetical protein [Candidatus Amarolinea aalborgensis]|jgi:hypothetical protein|uniref:hypothetical protein n=1 Tax=Candidatus Amarolinea aalborgensis TaxID=2249329 RepID=UPI003BFA0CC1